MKNNIEKKVRNLNDHTTGDLIIGGVIESIFPGIGILPYFAGGFYNSYAYRHQRDELQGFETNPDELLFYAFKNSTKTLIGATAISMLRYLF